MQTPIQIVFHGIGHSQAVEDHIRERAARLEHFHPKLMRCHVTIDQPHRHRQQGNKLNVRVSLQVPGEEIVVTNYAITVNGMPFAVAKALGYFKEEGANVTGILSSGGGGTTIRNLLGGNLAYGETSLASVVTAAQQGAKLKIISGNAQRSITNRRTSAPAVITSARPGSTAARRRTSWTRIRLSRSVAFETSADEICA